MLALLITVAVMYIGVIAMVLTDKNSKKYTDYQVRRILKQDKLFA